jgi:hypothetical protein
MVYRALYEYKQYSFASQLLFSNDNFGLIAKKKSLQYRFLTIKKLFVILLADFRHMFIILIMI